MPPRDDYFARVAPLIGDGLRHVTLAAEDLSLTAGVVELLSSCRLERVVVHHSEEPITWPLPATCRGSAVEGAKTALELLQAHLAWKNAWQSMQWQTDGKADATVSATLLAPGETPRVVWDAAARRVRLQVPAGDLWSHLASTYQVARELRDVLLDRQPWPRGTRYIGTAGWPFAESDQSLAPPPAPTLELGDKHILVVGCGSVGSEVTRVLGGHGARWTLIDGGEVSVFNPQRQWFGSSDVGRSKVEVLSERLAPERVRAVPRNLGSDQADAFTFLLRRDRPDLVLLTTGTSDDATLAQILWQEGIPHVAAYAYAQARFFEVSMVVPAEATPCLHCFRGHLYRGIESAAPMTDEVASFLYRDIDTEEREQLYVNLVAEPATRIDTARVGQVAAQVAAELLLPAGRRAGWLTRSLAASTTCLLGGNVVEYQEAGETSYGLTYPGQVVRLGLQDLVGSEAQRRCACCGRDLDTAYRVELPQADAASIDAALLG